MVKLLSHKELLLDEHVMYKNGVCEVQETDKEKDSCRMCDLTPLTTRLGPAMVGNTPDLRRSITLVSHSACSSGGVTNRLHRLEQRPQIKPGFTG